LTCKGAFCEFPGIKFEHNTDDGSINMTQKGLINKIIETAGVTNCNPNWTPASTTALGTDPDGEPMDEPWNCRSTIGVLLCLTTNTRPDCALAVPQAGGSSVQSLPKAVSRHRSKDHCQMLEKNQSQRNDRQAN
jgi:hypothetical protein